MIARLADNSGALATVGKWVKSKGVSAILCRLRGTFPVVLPLLGSQRLRIAIVKFSSYFRPLDAINYCKLVAEPIIYLTLCIYLFGVADGVDLDVLRRVVAGPAAAHQHDGARVEGGQDRAQRRELRQRMKLPSPTVVFTIFGTVCV